MDSLKYLFFDMDRKKVEGPGVDELFFSLLDARGKLLKISALDKSWPLLSLKSRYIPYPDILLLPLPSSSASSKRHHEQLIEVWRRAADSYHHEVATLVLETSYDRFWCHILHEPRRVLDFLRSFTINGTRTYDLQEMRQEDMALHTRIALLVFMAFCTISSPIRSQVEHITERKHGEAVQKFMKLPFLMDLCALFGGSGAPTEELLRLGMSSSFQKHRRLYTELRIALRDIAESLFQPLEDRLSDCHADMSKKPVSQLDDREIVNVVGYICDVLCAIRSLNSLASEDIQAVLLQVNLRLRLVQFAEKVVYVMNKEVKERVANPTDGPSTFLPLLNRAAVQGDIMEETLMETFRHLTCPQLCQADGPSGKDVVVFLSALLEILPHHHLFAITYEKYFPIRRDVELARRLAGNVEESLVDLLAHGVKDAFNSQKLAWDYSTSGQGRVGEKTVGKFGERTTHQSTADCQPVLVQRPNDTASTEADKITSQIMEMLGGMGLEQSYVEACVKHFKCDLNATVDAILSGSVPIEISNNTTSPLPSVELPAVTNLPIPYVSASSRGGYGKLMAHTAPGTVIDKVYYGKRDLYEETEEETISDATRLVTIARVQQMYDDEYDDTYDDFEAQGVRLNDKEEDTVTLDLKAMAEEDKVKKPPERSLQSAPSISRNQRLSSRGPQDGRLAPSSVHGQKVLPTSNPSQSNGYPGRGIDDVAGEEESRHEDDIVPSVMRSSDPWTRQMEENYAAQVSRRPPAPSTKQSEGDGKSRANKEKNKAHAANHNRKDRGQWKRNQGMF